MILHCERITIISTHMISTWIALIDPEGLIVGDIVGSESILPFPWRPDDGGSLGAFVNCDVGSHTVQ